MSEPLTVVPNKIASELLKEGYNFVKLNSAKMKKLLESSMYMDRDKAETDENYRQLVVYVTVFYDDFVLTYRRSGSEKRLHDLYTIGLGGHVNFVVDGCYSSALIREIQEELGISTSAEDYYFGGIIYSNKTAVDRVHLGLHFVLPIYDENVEISDEGYDLKLCTIEELKSLNLEQWSRLVVDSGVLDKSLRYFYG